MNKLFFFKDLDDHYHILFFGIKFCIKHKSKFKYTAVTEYGLTKENRTPQLIVSLSSYPARINTVHKTISTLLQQSLKPDKVILWLSQDEFPKYEEDLPAELLRLKDFGLTIKWCDNIKSYKKLVPALQEYPNDIIVTVDDDVYYQENTLKILYEAYLNNPNNIYVRRCVRIEKVERSIFPLSSRDFGYEYSKEPSYYNQLMGGSGCLYPPHSLHKDCTDVNIIKNTIPTHDDVYFWAMAVLNQTKIQVVGGFDENLYFIGGTQDVGLIHKNKKGKTGIALEDAYKVMINQYPQILSILENG